MKKFFLVLSFVLLVGAGCSSFTPTPGLENNKPPVVVPPEPTRQYVSEPTKEWTYTLHYPNTFTYLHNVDIQNLEGTGTYKGDSIVFSNELFDRSISDVRMNLTSDEGVCASTGEKVVFNGVNFIMKKVSDAGAGNQYTTESYYTQKGTTCYRIDLFEHTTTPENYASNEEEAKQFRVEHDATLVKIHQEFEKIMQTFQFSELPVAT